MSDTRITVDSVERLEEAIVKVRAAQKAYATFTQEQVDKIFFAAAMAANRERISLAKLAVAETGMGVVEDKVIKNHFASEYIYNAYRDTKTCGVIERDAAYGITKIAEPLGVIAAVIPTTNPTSTAIFKTLIALKTRNGIIISPHPRAKNCTIAAAKVVLDAAVAAGAPQEIISWVDVPSLDMTNLVMKECDCTLATGGPGMSCKKPEPSDHLPVSIKTVRCNFQCLQRTVYYNRRKSAPAALTLHVTRKSPVMRRIKDCA